MADNAQLKEQLGPAAVAQLADLLETVYPGFERQVFIDKAAYQLQPLELKARVNHVIEALAATLPAGFFETARILEAVADSWPAEPGRNWTSYAAWPLIDYVSVAGLNYPQRAFNVLEKLTPLFTAEFAIRPFLERHFDLTHQQLLRWTGHDNEHVRRLASEGIRPRLPWARQIPALREEPAPIWPILDRLKTDPSLYVRRSVANNLNDISKDHPQTVLAICHQWQQLGHRDTDWLIRHGLRTLVKTGHPEVYPLLGFSQQPAISSINLSLDSSEVTLGQTLALKLELETEKPQRLVVDYRVGFRRADDRLSWKVFKWKDIATQTNTTLTLHKRHAFKSLSSRQYYPGNHRIECLINGEVVARSEFELSLA